jgi:hypothetical protein
MRLLEVTTSAVKNSQTPRDSIKMAKTMVELKEGLEKYLELEIVTRAQNQKLKMPEFVRRLAKQAYELFEKTYVSLISPYWGMIREARFRNPQKLAELEQRGMARMVEVTRN